MQVIKLKNLKTGQLIAVCAIASFIALALTVFIGLKLWSQLSFNNRVLAKKTAAKNQLDANLEALPRLQANFNNLGGKERLIMRSLPARPDFPALATSMELITGLSGTKLQSISPPAPRTAGEGVVAIDFTVAAEGSYASILQFLTNLQLSARPMRINGVAVSGTGSILSVSAQVTTYYQSAKNVKPKSEVVQ